ncbi:DUF2269 family protein [Pseudomonas sp. NCCP-436]|uniref:DUF2269 family protein n=1 Tax=Pseudomonas sp. NCCP-436 TaxID=2842481 RepID=UPI001C80B01F|nr:DUF2269 family protein [Pseudomonas sp. NCCP-436]GIZ12528.1 hypothetical protein NCCP436_19440 [Pseudomonas sp. NCCP-436]
MEHYLLVRILHSAPGVLLLLGLIAHGFMLFRAQRSGDASVLARKLRVTLRYSLPAFAVLALSLPLSGFWLVDTAGWPLDQTWLLLGNVLFLLMLLAGLLLVGRLSAWRALGEAPASVALKRLCLIYAILIAVLLLAIMALMGAKPA